MRAEWIGILVLLKFFCTASYTAGDDVCKSTEKCECINITSSGTLEFQCPSSGYEENKTVIHVYRSAKKIRIDCTDIVDLNDTFLPEANFSEVTTLEIQECPLPRDGFVFLVKHLCLENLQFLSFSEHQLVDPLTVEDMQELKNLKALELKYNNMSVLDGEIFKNLPNLQQLSIVNNRIVLNENVFENTPNLRDLSINNNRIQHIPKGTFKHLAHLKTLALWGNNLKHLEHELFDDLVNLTMLELSLNEIEILEDQTFDHLSNLKQINLRRNKLKYISRRIFENCHSIELIIMNENPSMKLVDDVFSYLPELKTISLSNNELDHISENLFRGSAKLSSIDLSKNRLKAIPNKLFFNLENLAEIHLQHNQLDSIDEGLLENLKNLREINLSFNKIVRLPPNFLSRNKHLEKFLMSHNQFDFDNSISNMFSSFSSTNLKEVDLSHNNITTYPYNLNGITTMETIQLQHNSILSITVDQLTTSTIPLNIDLSFNKLNRIDFLNPKPSQPNWSGVRTEIKLSGNPIFCDCHAFNLAKYVQENNHPSREYFLLKYKELMCAGPQKMMNQSLEEIHMRELTCHLDKNCASTQSCECVYRPLDTTMVIDCSRSNLTQIPQLNDLSDFLRNYDFLDINQTEVHLEDNELQICPGEFDGYQNTSRWYLRGNSIRNITWIPHSLEVLDLRENHLEIVDAFALKVFNESKLNTLYLGNNPWKCECGLEDFLIYLRSHQIDMSDIRCNDTNFRLVDLNDKDLCPTETDFVLNITVVALFCLFIVTSTLSLYFLYQKEILIWLYGRGYCLWVVKEEELDKDKIYDAFISFSNKDEDFVIENLVSVLETGKEPYKLCIHFRDWIPGELIQTQIMHSVRDSRRTIVILSANFLESIWGIVEFKTAHNEAMREGRARVIIIICGDINMEALDDDLKAYLKTNTYIKWGDPWFWDKLKYALPKRSSRQVLSRKHANMMQYIEDKFKLIDKEPIRNVSTPIILSPADLEEKPLTCIA